MLVRNYITTGITLLNPKMNRYYVEYECNQCGTRFKTYQADYPIYNGIEITECPHCKKEKVQSMR